MAIVGALYAANGILLLILPLIYLVHAIGGEIGWQTGDPFRGGGFVHYVVTIVRSDRERAAPSTR